MIFTTSIAAAVLSYCSLMASTVASPIETRALHTFAITNVASDFKNVWFDGHSSGDIKIQVAPGETKYVALESGSSSMRVYEGCTAGNPSPGCTTRLNTATKLEWTFEGHQGDYINLSLVDGYNAGMSIDFGPSSSCLNMDLNIPQSVVKEKCPASNLIDNGGFVSCMSDCKAAEYNHGPSDHYCCEGAHHAHGTCAPSNQHFGDIASQGIGAYTWPHDNSQQQTCLLGATTLITLGRF